MNKMISKKCSEMILEEITRVSQNAVLVDPYNAGYHAGLMFVLGSVMHLEEQAYRLYNEIEELKRDYKFKAMCVDLKEKIKKNS